MTIDSGTPASPLWGDLSVQIDRPDGTAIRWGGDELDAALVPCDLSFGTSMPGGFKGATCTLFRALGLTGREGLFDTVTILGPGQEVVWEGRLQQMPASSDSGGRVNPQAVGWSAHLEDDATFREIYVDRELEGWRPVTTARRASITTLAAADGGQRADDSVTSAGPVLTMLHPSGSASWTSAVGRPCVLQTYDAGGIPLGSVEYRCRGLKNVAGWDLYASIWGDTAGATTMLAGLSQPPAEGARRVIGTPGTPATRAVELQFYYPSAPGGSPDNEYGLYLAEPAAYGAHTVSGVRTTGAYGSGEGPLAFRASDVLPDVLSRAAPLLRWSSATITPTDFLVRHLVFRDPSTAADVVQHLNKYHLWDWAVWEDRTFWWGPRSGGRTWTIATADGLDLSLEGDTTDNIWTGLLITYTDYAGVEHTVGPPGSSAERTDDRLLSYDQSNPATAHGIRRWGHLRLSVASDHESACTIGQAWLGAQAQATRRGSATVHGTVYDDASNPHPAWRVRAGDTLIVTDRPDDPPRRIIETNYTHAERSNQLTLDSTAATVDALIERIQASLVGVI